MIIIVVHCIFCGQTCRNVNELTGKLTIENDIGIAVVMPVFMEDGPDEDAVVVEVDW